jgi:FixJ family two-component response regulator
MLELAAALVAQSTPWPIIVLTTNPRRATIDLARNCGVTLIEKPLLGETLDDALRGAFDGERRSAPRLS